MLFYFIFKEQDLIHELVDSDSEDETERTAPSRKLYTIKEVDEELDVSRQDVSSFQCAIQLDISSEPINLDSKLSNESVINFDENPLNVIDLEIGSTEIPRFSCMNHKLNLAVRKAISLHYELDEMLNDINKACARIRRSVKLSSPFREKRCRLRCENTTRWSSSFLMLEAVLRAFKKGLFVDDSADEETTFPYRQSIIESYYLILRECHLLNLEFQKFDSSIGEVIPGN